jgi:hypothetical protein
MSIQNIKNVTIRQFVSQIETVLKSSVCFLSVQLFFSLIFYFFLIVLLSNNLIETQFIGNLRSKHRISVIFPINLNLNQLIEALFLINVWTLDIKRFIVLFLYDLDFNWMKAMHSKSMFSNFLNKIQLICIIFYDRLWTKSNLRVGHFEGVN